MKIATATFDLEQFASPREFNVQRVKEQVHVLETPSE